MRIVSILKPALFIYECVRIIILSFTLVFQIPAGSSALQWMSFTANGALFPLMALFIWLDISRYRPYLPLFIAGKCIAILSLLDWFIIFRQVTMTQGLPYVYIIAEMFFLCGDLLAMAAVLLVFKDIRKLTEKTAQNEVQDAEDK
jgi:hypothetical protein